MIVSHSHKFIYWKPMKVAGSSVLYGFGNQCDEERDIIGCPQDETEQKHKSARLPKLRRFLGPRSVGELNHASPQVIKSKIDDAIWNEYTKVTITRNPWDCVVSMYYWEMRKKRTKNFHSFLRTSGGAFNRKWYFSPQNEIWFDEVLRYETLQEDFNIFCVKHGMESARLPRLKTQQRLQGSGGSKKHYSIEYTDEDVEFVRQQWSKEIELFGYEFEDRR